MSLPTSKDYVAKAESAGRFVLPLQWKQMLLRSNGFTIEANHDDWDAFPVLDDSSRKHIARSANHILRETEESRGFPRFPPDAVAIAGNAYGDRLILLPNQSDVFVWDHETGEVHLADVTYPETKGDFEDLHA